MKTRPPVITALSTAVCTFLCAALTINGMVLQSPPSSSSEQALIDDLVLANRMLASSEAGVLDAYGNVSVRSRTAPKHFYIAQAVAPGLVTAQDIIEDDLDGNSVSGDRREQYEERFIHSAIYKARPDVAAIVHCQPLEPIAFSASTVPLYRGDDAVPVFDVRKLNQGQSAIVTAAFGQAVAEALGSRNTLLLRNQGAVVVSPTIYNLVIDAVGLRRVAQQQQQLIAMGGKWAGDPMRVAPNAPPAAQPASPLLLSRTGGGFGGVERGWDYFKQIVAPSITGAGALPRVAKASPAAHEATPDERAIDELISSNRIISYRLLGIVDELGHISVRSPRNPTHYFISRNVSAAFVTRSDIIENDLDSKAVGGPRSDEFQEAFIHGEIYKARPDVMAVLHAHTPEIRTFSLGVVMLRPIIDGAAFIGYGLPIHDIREFDPRETLIRTPALGRSLALVLADKAGVLLKGHGIALTGSSVHDVVQRAHDLRMNAQVQQQALALRGEVRYLDRLQSVRQAVGSRAWEYWKELVAPK